MSPVLFISSVTAEFRPLRRRIARLLERTKRVHVRHQDDFFNRGVLTLRMLEEEVRNSTCVIHLIGEQLGWIPPLDQVRSFLDRHPEFLNHFPELAVGTNLTSMCATQWEAWLAAFFEIERFACFALSPTGHDMRLQQPHIERLIRHHIHPTVVRARTRLFDEIFGLLVETGYLDTQPSAQPQHPNRVTLTIGRNDEIDAIKNFFTFEDTVIIWGPGGSGKTTLARSLAADYQDQKVAVFWVDLLRVNSLDGIYSELLNSIDDDTVLEGRAQSDNKPLSERVARVLRRLGSAY